MEQEHLVPIYIEVEDGERLMRALQESGSRKFQGTKRCAEDFLRIRRFLEENLSGSGYTRRYRMTHKDDAKMR